jgi:phenylalanyl-tRNA synthetase beta chain
MKLTYSWLKEFISFEESPEEIAEKLTMAGFEVDSLIELPENGSGSRDWVMEISITPNRGDCLGVMGLAREIAALTGGSWHPPSVTSSAGVNPAGEQPVKVRIAAPRLCPRYSARVVQALHVAPSPCWMQLRLEQCGIRSINNIVDVTNYVMLETGQPLHAFDFDRLATKKITVLEAGNTPSFVTLDGIERKLEARDLLIWDGDTPVALAGIMGGARSEVGPETRAVLIESAHFDPLSIRRTAKRLGLHTEASHRFERGVDPDGTVYALNRTTSLLMEIARGVPFEGLVDSYPRPKRAKPILVRDRRVQTHLGMTIARNTMDEILRSLGMKLDRAKSGVRAVPPSYRFDITREADLIEELARVYGYGRIPSRLPLIKPRGAGRDLRLEWERKVRAYLTGEGLTEAVNLSFASEKMNRIFYGLTDGRRKAVSVLNPLVQEQSQLRLSLIPGLTAVLRAHAEQKLKSFLGFELGKVFYRDPDEERYHLAGVLYGQREFKGLRPPENSLTFLEMKGLLEGFFELMGLENKILWCRDRLPSYLHPGRAANLKWGETPLGTMGEIHPDFAEELDVPPFLLFELDFDMLLQYGRNERTYCPLPRFPSVQRDVALLVDESLPAHTITAWIRELQHPVLKDVELFDDYRGPSIPEGKKSLAYTLSYRALDRTLTDTEVNAVHEEMITRITNEFGAQPRT